MRRTHCALSMLSESDETTESGKGELGAEVGLLSVPHGGMSRYIDFSSTAVPRRDALLARRRTEYRTPVPKARLAKIANKNNMTLSNMVNLAH